MLLNFGKRLCCVFLLLLLVACAIQQKFESQQIAKLGKMSRNDFMNAMRWKQYDVASEFMLPEHRKSFMKTFMSVKDVHIFDVRLAYLGPLEENRLFETTIEMDYYLLPSVTIKTFQFDQTWTYFEGDDPAQQGFLIVTPFPDFP